MVRIFSVAQAFRLGSQKEGKMPICACGCGGETQGRFCREHDQILQTRMEEMVGGLLKLEARVEVACD
jgi:hypothetical protein